MSVTGYRQLPNPTHHVEIIERHLGTIARYTAICRTDGCTWSFGPIAGYVGPASNAARVHVDGVKCCEGAP